MIFNNLSLLNKTKVNHQCQLSNIKIILIFVYFILIIKVLIKKKEEEAEFEVLSVKKKFILKM
jgi:hypothetical protein